MRGLVGGRTWEIGVEHEAGSGKGKGRARGSLNVVNSNTLLYLRTYGILVHFHDY